MSKRLQSPSEKGNYHTYKGLLDFSATIPHGITVVLGATGSGKSTLLKLTATLLVPDDGRITYIDEEKDDEVTWSKASMMQAGVSCLGDLKEQISYVPAITKIDHDLTVESSLIYLAQLRRIRNPKRTSAELIAKWGLAGVRKLPLFEIEGTATLKRYLLAQSLLGDPKIWILDEPTTGLDELGRRLLWEELANQPSSRLTLIATTDDMKLAEFADYLMLLESGYCRRLGQRKYLTASVADGTVATWYQAMQTFSFIKSY
ncbi:ATP-binding cassette domain-containing protein [Hazenella coriacea]|uniref:ATP-binding cassette domain-containing protein n=1 Tax=Hazenella coriacea TaxID=1179467 RepID=UPI0014048C03|nr:ATP-binding cassette domain-containing protein [Hazenella coriacea]